MIPVKYNIRNLRIRWVTTLMTVISTGLIIWIMVITFGMTDGLEHSLRVSGHPLDLIVMREGSASETGSTITPQAVQEIAALPGIDQGENGQPLCSAEYATILTKPRRNNGGTTNLIVRGVEEVSRQLRPDFKIVDGRDLRPGLNELITSRSIASRFENCGVGEKLEINRTAFTVVGLFEAGGSSAESEVWADARDVASATRGQDSISVVNLRARDEAAKEQLMSRIQNDKQLNLDVKDEITFFAEQMSSGDLAKFLAYLLAFFLTLVAMFAAANTMYAAVANRSREIGTLRAIGFHRSSILVSFLIESTLLCLMGGLIGCLATLPFNGLSTGTMNAQTFSEMTFAFRFGPWVILRGLVLALLMGLIGGLFPALRAVRLNIVSALREQ